LERRDVSGEDLLFPSFDYHLDDSDPDIVELRRQDGSFVAAFSVRGMTREGITEAAREDYRELVRANWAWLGKASEEQHSA
jgi:hypothetical protein